MDKKSIIVAVVIVVLACAYYWWSNNQKPQVFHGKLDAVGEPPIEWQYESQCKAIAKGKDIPIPIPIYIAGTRIDSLDFDGICNLLPKLGYREFAAEGDPGSKADPKEVFRRGVFANPKFCEYITIIGSKTEAFGRVKTGVDVTIRPYEEWMDYFIKGVGINPETDMGPAVGVVVGGISTQTNEIEIKKILAGVRYEYDGDYNSCYYLSRGMYSYGFTYSEKEKRIGPWIMISASDHLYGYYKSLATSSRLDMFADSMKDRFGMKEEGDSTKSAESESGDGDG